MLRDQIEPLEEKKLIFQEVLVTELSEQNNVYSPWFRIEYLINNKLQIFHLPSVLMIFR